MNRQDNVGTEPLDLAIDRIRTTAVADPPAEVIDATREAISQSRPALPAPPARHLLPRHLLPRHLLSRHLLPRHLLPRHLLPRHLLRSAAAVLVTLMILGLIGLIAFPDTSPRFTVVGEKVEATQNMRAVIVDQREGGTLYVSGTRSRFEGNGVVVLTDTASGKELMLHLETKTAHRLPGRFSGGALDLYKLFGGLTKAATAPINPFVDKSGKRFPGFSGKTTLGEGGPTVDANVWVHPESNLPVRVEIQFGKKEGGERLLAEQIEFDVPMKDDLFEMELPAGFQIVGMTEEQLKPPPDEKEAAKLTIVPGVGISDVKFGMSRDQIVAILGEPDFTQHGVYLTYASKGLQLVLVGREPDKLGMIIANPGDAASLVRHDFPGQTDKGIRMGSSADQIRKAYGQPDPLLRGAAPTSIGYKKLGLGFTVINDKVNQIFVVRTD